MGVPGTASPGRQPLPGEHGFRFFPGCYQHVPDTMSRIPFPGNPNGVLDNLVQVEGTVAGFQGLPPIFAPVEVGGLSQFSNGVNDARTTSRAHRSLLDREGYRCAAHASTH